jgi:hypothetical protein
MLEVAERVFYSRGWQAATMDEIAERVGVTQLLMATPWDGLAPVGGAPS